MQHHQTIGSIPRQETNQYQFLNTQPGLLFNHIKTSTSGTLLPFSQSLKPTLEIERIPIKKNHHHFQNSDRQSQHKIYNKLKGNVTSAKQLNRGLIFKNDKNTVQGSYHHKTPDYIYPPYKNTVNSNFNHNNNNNNHSDIPNKASQSKQIEKNSLSMHASHIKQQEFNNLQTKRKTGHSYHIEPVKNMPSNKFDQKFGTSFQAINFLNHREQQQKLTKTQEHCSKLKAQNALHLEEIKQLKKNISVIKQKDEKKWQEVGIFASQLKRKADEKAQKYDKLELIYAQTEKKYQKSKKAQQEAIRKYQELEIKCKQIQLAYKQKEQLYYESLKKGQGINLQLESKLSHQETKTIQVQSSSQQIISLREQLQNKYKQLSKLQNQKVQYEGNIKQLKKLLQDKEHLLTVSNNKLSKSLEIQKHAQEQFDQCRNQLKNCYIKLQQNNILLQQYRKGNVENTENINAVELAETKSLQKENLILKQEIQNINKKFQNKQDTLKQTHFNSKQEQLTKLLQVDPNTDNKDQIQKTIMQVIEKNGLQLVISSNKQVELKIQKYEMQKQLKWCNKKLSDLRIKMNHKNGLINQLSEMVMKLGLKNINQHYKHQMSK